MRLKKKLTSVLALAMVLSVTMALPVFAKVPKQPTGIPITQYPTIPETQYIPEPPQEKLDGTASPQWSAAVHTNIIREGIAKFKRDNPLLASRLTTQISLGGGLYTTPENLLIGGINWPDSNETDNNSYKGHFFDPYSRLNYNQEITPTAYTRFSNHYVSGKNATNATTAWKELSYSLHYFGDLNAPHHAANVPMLVFGDLTHTPFEQFADNNYSNFTTSWTGDYFVVNSTILDIALYYAKNAQSYIGDATSSNDTYKRRAINNTLPFAQAGAAGMIKRFVTETNW